MPRKLPFELVIALKTADVKGFTVIRIVKVRTYIEQKMAERRRTGINQTELQELAKIAFVKATDLIDPKIVF